MTTYTNSVYVKRLEQWIKNKNFYNGKVVGRAGTFPMGEVAHSQKTIQVDKIYAAAASIKKSDDREYPESAEAEMASATRKLKWFTGGIEWKHLQHEDFVRGDQVAVEKTREKLDAVGYKFDYDQEMWFSGYSTTFANDPDYDPKWVPWFGAQSSATSTPSNPADLNDKVTNMAGTTGTTATILSMATVLTSTTTNMTLDFAEKTFQPIIDAISDFQDSNNGGRMVDGEIGSQPTAVFGCHVAPALARRLLSTKVFDGEKLTSRTVAQDMADMGILIIPNRDFTASLIEDGTCQFGFEANMAENFQIGIANQMVWEPDDYIPGRNKKWFKNMNVRQVPWSRPFYDGSKWYKAFFHGSFVFRNDSA